MAARTARRWPNFSRRGSCCSWNHHNTIQTSRICGNSIKNKDHIFLKNSIFSFLKTPQEEEQGIMQELTSMGVVAEENLPRGYMIPSGEIFTLPELRRQFTSVPEHIAPYCRSICTLGMWVN
jgi:hypothetical protein